MIYSPLPPELIWLDSNQEQPKIEELVINNIPMQLMITGEKTARIERILSTDPQDYLNLKYQPGTPIEYRPSAT